MKLGIFFSAVHTIKWKSRILYGGGGFNFRDRYLNAWENKTKSMCLVIRMNSLFTCHCWLSASLTSLSLFPIPQKRSNLQQSHSLFHDMKNFHCCENCLSYIIHHSNHHAFIWFCQKIQFYCRFILLQWSVFISALILLQCQSPHTHRGKWSLCQEIIPQKHIVLQTWLLHWCLLTHTHLPGQPFISH